MRPPSSLHVTLAERLYPTELGVLRDALPAPPYTALLTGGDSATLRALAFAALPDATITSCLAEEPPSVDVPLIIHDAHCNGGTLLRAVLDGEHVQVLATAPSIELVPRALRMPHRLHTLVTLRAPTAKCASDTLTAVCSELSVTRPPALHGGVKALARAAAEFYASPLSERDARFARSLQASSVDLPCNARVLTSGAKTLPGYETLQEEFVDLLTPRDAPRLKAARPPRGVLLHGPRGVGKTRLASAVAASLPTVRFLSVACADAYSRYLGETEARLRALFAHARRHAPCVLVLDGFEAIAAPRSMSSESTGVERRVLGALLAELDGTSGGNDGVQVLAIAVDIERVDEAARRPGRIDRVVEMMRPNEEQRAAILSTVASAVSEEDSAEASKLMHGMTPADMIACVRTAATAAMNESGNPKQIKLRHLRQVVSQMESCTTELEVESDKGTTVV